MSQEILRLVDTIHRSKEIDKEIVFQGIESALLSAVRKKHGESEEIQVTIDRDTGSMRVLDGEEEIDTEDLGRLAAMAGKQVLLQKIREAERDHIYDEYEGKVGKLVSGLVHRYEGGNLIVDLGKVDGFLPRSEQAPGERFKVGERIKVLIKDIRKNINRVKLTLSRTSPDLIRALFELEVPEIADKVIEIKEIAREPGYRTKIAVTTYDSNVDCVGACVGVRGSRIKNIVDELFGEKIDIVRWNESVEVLIMNALKPAEIASMDLDFDTMAAKIYVKSDQQSLAIGKRGQNVRLASKMTGWQLDIETITDEELESMRKEEAREARAEAAKPASASPETDDAEPSEESADAEDAAPEEAAARDGDDESGAADGEGADRENTEEAEPEEVDEAELTDEERLVREADALADRLAEQLAEEREAEAREEAEAE